MIEGKEADNERFVSTGHSTPPYAPIVDASYLTCRIRIESV